MYVWFDGKVNPCDADYKSLLSYGDVSKDSIASVWKSKKIELMRSKHLLKLRGKIIPCDRCGLDFSLNEYFYNWIWFTRQKDTLSN